MKCPDCGKAILQVSAKSCHKYGRPLQETREKTKPKRKSKKIAIKILRVIGFLCVLCGIGYYLYHKQPNPIVYKSKSPKVETFTVNGVQFKMIKVESGTFNMGETPEQGNDVYGNERPIHSVTLWNYYYIGETEVTQELWEAVMGSNPSVFKGNNQRPVENVSWKDCQEFIKRLNCLTGRRFYIPTEAEWEYAARGGKYCKDYVYKYSGSNNPNEVAWYWRNIGDKYLSGDWEVDKIIKNECKTHPVKTKKANKLGIYDMSGNVWEWCTNRYENYQNYYQLNPEELSENEYRVIRGGDRSSDYWHGRVSERSFKPFDYHSNNGGLRLAL
ncbi:MAG: formylglycine-generating enzyme family protein [Candidatus Onthomorpha sp.]